MGSNTLDVNRSGIRRLILDAEDAVSFLSAALENPDFEVRATAMRNGRLIYKELIARQKNFLLPPVSAIAIEKLLDEIRSTIRRLFESLSAV